MPGKKTEKQEEKPTLYGIYHSNRSGDDLWGKNQFNSTFPTALACYMREKEIKPVYLTVDSNLKVVANEISVSDLFNTTKPNNELRFDYESKYEPYQAYAFDDIGAIDLVVKHEGEQSDSKWRRPLEVKLTVLPDNTTCTDDEGEWGSELVIRPASTKYCALGIRHSLASKRDNIREILEGVCGQFHHWDSSFEVIAKREQIITSLNLFQKTFYKYQQPFLMQPIWKTKGKSPVLSEQAFDIFIWSDFALCRAFLDKSKEDGTEVNRYMRSSARLARVLYELSTREKTNLNTIYTEMAFGHQTDKEFALPGKTTKIYMDSDRRKTPVLSHEVVADIILNGGEKKLSPERRFDATIYFTADSIFEERRKKEEVKTSTS